MSLITVAACTLHTLPLDFEANRDAVLEGIRLAKARGATLVTTPELCIPGYGCLDHHLEAETFTFSWEMLSHIIADPICRQMICDVGMGVRHRNVRYNARVVFTYKKLFLIRPKMALANDGLYREMRHFTPWLKERTVETYYLEDVIADITGQKTVPIGDAIISTKDTSISIESCEELFTPRNPSIGAGLNGAEIILNSSASHAELRKLRTRLDLIANQTRKLGGVYVYSNATGVDGEARQAFDGSSLVVSNGRPLAQDVQFSLKKVSVCTATLDIESVRTYRDSISRNLQAAAQDEFVRVEADIRLSRKLDGIYLAGEPPITKPIELKFLDPMEEIHRSTGVWLWQYLCTTNSAGFLLPLSGGADSCCTALTVFGSARLVMEAISEGDEQCLADLRRVTGEKDFMPTRPQDIVAKIFHTVYMGYTLNSGEETRRRARLLAKEIGAYHSDGKIDDAVGAMGGMVKQTLGFVPQYTVNGGTNSENLALQNIQARTRMVYAYSLAQLSTLARNTPRQGVALLVLGSANVDELLRGYLTKYDCSSADINPIGSISKTDVKAFARWARDAWDLPILDDFINATPSAELLPLSAGEQSDEVEMGLTYEELSTFGLLRINERCGPWTAYLRLLSDWKDTRSPGEIADKVMKFFRFYAMNRHKLTVTTPSLHLSSYNPDDNRHDLRPFLYVISWPWQFKKIRAHCEMLELAMGRKTIKAD